MVSIGDLLVRIMPMSELSTTIFPPAATFDPERDMPSLKGKVMIVTGGNAGIGFETCRQLLLHDAKVYLLARSSAKGLAAVAQLKQETGKEQLEFIQCDLGDLSSVRAAAAEYLRQESTLSVLFNNAGVMIPPIGDLTAQEFDLQWGTNVVGPYLLSTLLLPALKATKGRILNTSSSAHNFAPAGSGLEFATLVGSPERDATLAKWGSLAAPWTLYGQSKLANILISNLWAREFAGEVTVCSLHPGGIRTELQRHAPAWQQRVAYYLLYPTTMGALTQVYAGTTADASAVNGKFLNPWARIHRSNPQGDNVATQELLRDWLDEQVAKF